MSEPRLSGLAVARWATDFNISPDVAWRQIREGSVEFRAIVARHYCTSERMDETQRYVAEPELMDQGIDEYLRDMRSRGARITDREACDEYHPNRSTKSQQRRYDDYPGGSDQGIRPAPNRDGCDECARAGLDICRSPRQHLGPTERELEMLETE